MANTNRKARKEGYLAVRMIVQDEDRIKRLAALEQRSVSELVAALCNAYINKHYKPEYDTYFIQPKEL